MSVPDELSAVQIVQARLRDLIDGLPAGARIPGERDLSARWRVARMTLRRAVDSLVQEGRLSRRHGSGTYVTSRPFARLLGLTSFTEDMRSRGLVPSSRLLEFRRLSADPGLAGRLRIPAGDEVLRFTRLRLGDGEPMALETVWVPVGYVPGLAESDLDGSLYEVLATRFGITIGAANATLEPILPNAGTAQLLGITAQQPCLRVQMVDIDHRQRTVMNADCIYRGDRFRHTAEMSAPAGPTLPFRRRIPQPPGRAAVRSAP